MAGVLGDFFKIGVRENSGNLSLSKSDLKMSISGKWMRKDVMKLL